MTREDAIEIIKSECYVFNPLNFDSSTRINTALDMAIKALSQESSEDVISRQAAIDALDEQIALCNKALGSFDISMKEEYAVKVERASLKAYREALNVLPSAQPEQQHGRVFKGIVVEYSEYCIYPEYKGKPYFSIKYAENGQEFIGYSTYKLEVLSEYLKEYFMPSAQPEPYNAESEDKE